MIYHLVRRQGFASAVAMGSVAGKRCGETPLGRRQRRNDSSGTCDAQ
jgi:hypothetical protein